MLIGNLLICRKCRWAGEADDLHWGGCPACRGRRFVTSLERWTRKLGWGFLIGLLAYYVSHVPLG